MNLGFSRRNVVRHAPQESRRPPKRRRLRFDCLEDRRMLSGGTLNTTSPEAITVPGTNVTAPMISTHSVAMDSNGDTVVVWSNSPPSGSSTYSLYFELYAKIGSGASSLLTPVAGGPLETTSGTPITNSGYTGSGTIAAVPVVAMSPTSGQFAVGWSDSGSATTNSAHVQLYSYSISTDGTTSGTIGSAAPVGNEILAGNSGKAQMYQIAMNDQGFDVLYGAPRKNYPYLVDPTVERYSSTGAASGSAITVADLSNNSVSSASIAMDANGNFVVGWQYNILHQTGVKSSYYYEGTINWQRYTSNGTAYGTIQPVVLGDSQSQVQYAVNLAMDANDDVVTAYGNNPGLSTIEITASNVVEPPTLVDPNANGGPGVNHAAISLQSSGTYSLSWVEDTSGNFNFMANTFDLSGSALQSPIVVHAHQSGQSNHGISAAIDSSGDVVVVYGVWSQTTGGGLFGDFYQDPPTSVPTTTTASTASSSSGAAAPIGSVTAATDAVFAAYAYLSDDDTLR